MSTIVWRLGPAIKGVRGDQWGFGWVEYGPLPNAVTYPTCVVCLAEPVAGFRREPTGDVHDHKAACLEHFGVRED
jgi:hypothetical protein